ncbi:MAG: hypothetical protein Q7W51_08845 [Coriobacteriia bacterium]|nr:hypothetical protein [Coriobacteriia bacterium]
MGEKAARERLWLTKKPWRQATEGLVKKGLIMEMSNVRFISPRTIVGCPAAPFDGTASDEEVLPRLQDRHAYRGLGSAELVKMPWRLLDGRGGTEPVLAEVQDVAGLVILLAMYLVAAGDGLLPRVAACLEPDMYLRHGIAGMVPHLSLGLSSGEIAHALRGLLDIGLVYPLCEDSRDRHVLQLFHPLEAPANEAEPTTAL